MAHVVIAAPRDRDTGDDYILDGEFLLCLMCHRWMHAAPSADGTRTYWCGPPCSRGHVPATRVEADAELGAFTRAITTLCPDLAQVRLADVAPLKWGDAEHAEIDTDELRRWTECDLTDRRAVVRTAYARGEVDAEGCVHLVPHDTEAAREPAAPRPRPLTR